MESDVGKTWKEIFDNRSDIYHFEKITKSYFDEKAQSIFVSELLNYGKDGSRILEAGCGSGSDSIVLSIKGREATVLDISQRALDEVRRLKMIAEQYFGEINLRIVKGDIRNMYRLLEGTYDVVFNHGVIEHWLDSSERMDVIRQMITSVSPGGYVVIAVPNTMNLLYKLIPLHSSTPRMANYNLDLLERELKACGCEIVTKGGLGVSRGFEQWLRFPFLKGLIELLDKLFYFLPREWKTRFGAHVFCVGAVKR